MAVSSVFSCCLLVLFSWRWLLRIIYIYIAVIDHKLCFLSSASHGIYSTTFFSFFLIFPPNCLRATLWSSITVRRVLPSYFLLWARLDFLCTLFYWTVFPPRGLQCWTKYSLLIMTQNKYVWRLANIHNFSFHLIFSSLHFHQYSPWLTVQSYQSNSEKNVGSLESPKANRHSKWSIIHKDSPIKILFFFSTKTKKLNG